MAALTATNPTLLDFANHMDPDGKIAAVVEILDEVNDMVQDITFQEGNLSTGHRTTIRTGIPTPTWRRFNEFVQPTKGTTAQITHNTGMLRAYAEIDVDLANLNGNSAEYRLSEDRVHLEGIAQEFADTLIFGNEGTEPAAFTGLAPYYNDTTADNGENIILGGSASGQTDNASIWLVVWGPNTVHGIFPKGSKAGVTAEDKGRTTIYDANGGRMEVYQSYYAMDAGLAVRDWRYAVRIPNIDKSLLSAVWTSGAFGSSADLSDLMFQAMRRVPNLNMGRPVFYMSRDMLTWLGRQTSAKTQGSTLKAENIGGRLVESFNTIPIRRCDVLAADEARVA